MVRGSAVPMAETPNRIAQKKRVFFLPQRSVSPPPKSGPMMHPMTALLTANPSQNGLRANSSFRKRLAPAMMERSYPKMNPPTAATRATR
jgi:hypothetical protein